MRKRRGVGCSRKLAAESFAEPDFNQFSSAKFNRLLDTVNDETIRTIERQRPGIVLQHPKSDIRETGASQLILNLIPETLPHTSAPVRRIDVDRPQFAR